MVVSLPYSLTDGKGYSWSFNSYGTASNSISTELYSGGRITPSFYMSDNKAKIELNDRQLVYGTMKYNTSIEHDRKIYVSDKEGFVRYLEIFKNAGTETKTQEVELYSSYQNYDADVVLTSNSDSVFTTGDDWLVRDKTTNAHAAVAHVIGGADGLDPVAVSLSNSQISYDYNLVLNPGETKILMYYIALAPTAEDAAEQAKSLWTFQGDALKGLTSAEKKNIVNFDLDQKIQLEYVGGAGADVLVGDLYDETFKGGAGNDVISAGDGDDKVYGEHGDDTLLGGNGDDLLVGGSGKDVIHGGNGDDEILGDFGSRLVTTSASKTIPSTGEQISISMTLLDQSNAASIPVAGFVSRTPITSAQFNISFVIDVSGSADYVFNGDVSVGDRNGDGASNTVLDAEIAGFEALLEGITKQVGAENVNVAIIPFESDARTAFSGSAAQDADGDGVSDVLANLRSLRAGGGTDFESGLQETVKFFQKQDEGQNLVFFLSDGENNEGGSFADEVQQLLAKNGLDASIRSFGVGKDADKDDLDLLDDGVANNSAQIVLDPSELSKVLIDPGIQKSDVHSVRFYVNEKLVKTIPGARLEETPLGLRFSYDTVLSGLDVNKDDKIVAMVIANDKAKTRVSTEQILEVDDTTEGADVLLGGGGKDLIYGGGGDDTINGEAGDDVLYGDAGADKVSGGRGADVLYGGDGNDVLNGGKDVDQMFGGKGDDYYYVDHTDDKVIERAGEGRDRVHSTASYTLSAQVEDLILTGTAHINGVGNSLSNRIIGNAGNNTLTGGAGNDTLTGGAGNDKLHGGVGLDKIYGGLGNDTAYGDAGNDQLYGEAGNDRLYGGLGDDRLEGGAGNDILDGGAGVDTLNGGAGNDTIKGGAGKDKLTGGLGADKLEGGGDADLFIFSSVQESTVAASGRDTISDFNSSQLDRIDLSAIDANTTRAGDQAFSFIGLKAFSKKAGELRYVKDKGDAILSGDVNGDGKADFSILLTDNQLLQASDFIL